MSDGDIGMQPVLRRLPRAELPWLCLLVAFVVVSVRRASRRCGDGRASADTTMVQRSICATYFVALGLNGARSLWITRLLPSSLWITWVLQGRVARGFIRRRSRASFGLVPRGLCGHLQLQITLLSQAKAHAHQHSMTGSPNRATRNTPREPACG